MNILITGMSEMISAATRLAPQAELSALNRRRVEGVPKTRADIDAIRPAFDGQDMVAHLAAKASNNYPWKELLPTNNRGHTQCARDCAGFGLRIPIRFRSEGGTGRRQRLQTPFCTRSPCPERISKIDFRE